MDERDASWNKSSVTVDDVWLQRRIELWGEGFSMADIMRLGKPVVRFQGSDKGNWPDAFCFNIAADRKPVITIIGTDHIRAIQILRKTNCRITTVIIRYQYRL